MSQSRVDRRVLPAADQRAFTSLDRVETNKQKYDSFGTSSFLPSLRLEENHCFCNSRHLSSNVTTSSKMRMKISEFVSTQTEASLRALQRDFSSEFFRRKAVAHETCSECRL